MGTYTYTKKIIINGLTLLTEVWGTHYDWVWKSDRHHWTDRRGVRDGCVREGCYDSTEGEETQCRRKRVSDVTRKEFARKWPTFDCPSLGVEKHGQRKKELFIYRGVNRHDTPAAGKKNGNSWGGCLREEIDLRRLPGIEFPGKVFWERERDRRRLPRIELHGKVF